MYCIFKTLIVWPILVALSGGVGLFLQQAFLGLFVAFPPESTDPATPAALKVLSRRWKRGHAMHTIFCFLVSILYLGAIAYFYNVTLALTAFLVMATVVVDGYAETPPWVHHVGNVILWGSSILVWYAVCN